MKAANKTNRSKRRGMALAMVLLLMIILFAIGTGLLGLSRTTQVLAIRNCNDIIARSAADAGLAKAIFEMNEKLKVTPWDDSTLPMATNVALTNGGGASFSYTITKDINDDDVYIVVSTGTSAQAQRQVISTLRLKGLFEYGLLTKETITVGGNTQVDGYDSGTDDEAQLMIGTLSIAPDNIILGNGSVIDGDVFVGFGGDTETVIQNLGAVINGQTYVFDEGIMFPVIIPPSLPVMGTINVAGTTVVGPADNGTYTTMILQDFGILRIDGGDVVLHMTGDVVMNSSSQIQVYAGSSLTLYVDGNMVGDSLNNLEINNYTGIPVGLKLCLMGEDEQTLEFKNNSDLFMAIYAPNADVIFKNNTNFRGSIVAKSVYMQNNSVFYYDKALQSESIGDSKTGMSFVIDRWQE